MNNTQNIINSMHEGKKESILSGISSDIPIVVLNAILAGTRISLHDKGFLDGVRAAEKNHVDTMLGIPLSKFATASLHLLGIKEYTGTDSVIKKMIELKFEL